MLIIFSPRDRRLGKRFRFCPVLIILLVQVLGTEAGAQVPVPQFPYTTRTHAYQGYTALVKGDNNNIGMAGANVALPVGISSMQYNPAGFAMFLGGLSALINKNTVDAPEMNHFGNDVTEYQWGLGTAIQPWGFGITYYSPASENVGESEVSTRQLRVSVARMLGNKLSIGAGVELDRAVRNIGGDDLGAFWFSTHFGLLYKVQNNWTLGFSVKPAIDIPASTNFDSNAARLGFNQETRFPTITSIGVGYLPNRFFRAGFSIFIVGGTDNTASLYRDKLAYGQDLTVQPRLGASYVLAEYRHFKSELAAGTYYEFSRMEGLPNRLHATFSLEVNPYFVNTGIAADWTTTYKNWIVSIGVDIVRLLRTFEIIPLDPVPPRRRMFPPMTTVDYEGLPRGFTLGIPNVVAPPSAGDIRKIVEDIPAKVQEKLIGKPADPPKSRVRSKKKKH